LTAISFFRGRGNPPSPGIFASSRQVCREISAQAGHARGNPAARRASGRQTAGHLLGDLAISSGLGMPPPNPIICARRPSARASGFAIIFIMSGHAAMHLEQAVDVLRP